MQHNLCVGGTGTEKKRDRNKTMIFDTHAHYDDEAFEEDRGALIASLTENGMDAWLMWQRTLLLYPRA